MDKILLVEDSEEFQHLIKKSLGELARGLSMAVDCAEAKTLLKEINFDLILLDISLPDQDGLSFFNELKNSPETANIPVIFITGKSAASDIVAAFSIGAEDYIVKPFEPMVMHARIRARLSKIHQKRSRDEVIEIENLVANLGQMKAYSIHNGKKRDLKLTPTEFKLFYHLVRTQEQVFSRDQLLSLVWGENVDVFDRTVDAHISTLRKKLGEYSGCVEAVMNVGYRFSLTAKNIKKTRAA